MAYTDNKQVPSNINYTSKDFSTIKADLIEYTKSYFPDTYKDFNETSPGMMLIELASYVGDVLSYYIDYNYKESLLTTATERKNVIRLAEFLGYKTTPTTHAIVKLKVTNDFVLVSPDMAFTYLIALYLLAIPSPPLSITVGTSGEPDIVKSISPSVSNINSEFSLEATFNPLSIGV